MSNRPKVQRLPLTVVRVVEKRDERGRTVAIAVQCGPLIVKPGHKLGMFFKSLELQLREGPLTDAKRIQRVMRETRDNFPLRWKSASGASTGLKLPKPTLN